MTTHRKVRQKAIAARHENGDGWVTCGSCGKRVFHNKRAARAAAEQLRQANARAGRTTISEGAVIRPYRAAETCGTAGWHLGHRTGRGRPNLNDPRLTHLPEARS